ncbi:MAG: PAS domain S-box protein, partial [Gemmatimonadales bacterium]|nr:PAS domain S-box protein [Gemmatimonadales bacterium]
MRSASVRKKPVGPASGPVSGFPSARSLLLWLYVGRVSVAIVVFVAAAFSYRAVDPGDLVILAIAAIASVGVTSLSVWHTHVRGTEPGLTFLYVQAVFDLTLVTTVVHVTEGAASQFPALYIPVIAVSSVLMPFRSSLLVTVLASLLYLADITWWQPVHLSVVVWLQVAVFVAVFVATGLLASRIRVVREEHQVLQREVRRLRLEASDILRNIRSAVITVDGQGVLMFANPAALELLGIGDDGIGGTLADLLGDRAPSLLEAIARTQSSRLRGVRSEGEMQADGRSFPIGVTTTSIETGQDAPPSVTAIFTDISEQKRIDALHLRTERLEAVAELSASLAHEIRNPLASIRSSIEQIADSVGEDADERVLAELVLRESDRLTRLLTEFLDFSRVRVTRRQRLDLGRVAESAVEVVRNHSDCPAGATIDVRADPAPLEGDEDLLHRVAVNLVLNAVQASRGRAVRVTVEVREARASDHFSGMSDGPAVLLRVVDDGPGIPPDLRDRLFEPFVSGRRGGSG